VGFLAVWILAGVLTKWTTRQNLRDLGTEQNRGIDLDTEGRQQLETERKTRLMIGCLLSIIFVLGLALAGIWYFFYFFRASGHGHPG
jgi:hypothetical protein